MSTLEKSALSVLVALILLIAGAQFLRSDDTSAPPMDTAAGGRGGEVSETGEGADRGTSALDDRRKVEELDWNEGEGVVRPRPGPPGGGDSESPSGREGGEGERFSEVPRVDPPAPGPGTGEGEEETEQPGPEVTPRDDPAPKGREYVVRDGDSPWRIAAAEYGKGHAHRMSQEIVKANPGLDPKRLRAGQKIVLPPLVERSSRATPRTEKTASAKPAPNPAERARAREREALGFIQPDRSHSDPGSGRKGRGVVRTYVVQPGDTLGAIAQRELGSVRHTAALAELNGLSDVDALQVGQVLRLPGR